MLLDVSYGDGNKEETAKPHGQGLIRSRRNGPTRSWRENRRSSRCEPSPRDRALRLWRRFAHAQDGLKLPSFRLVNSDEIERGGDRVHFTTAGRLELGRRYAAAMIELLPVAK